MAGISLSTQTPAVRQFIWLFLGLSAAVLRPEIFSKSIPSPWADLSVN